MKYPVVLHRRVHKKIHEGKVPHDKVAKCLLALSSGDGKTVGLGMKRLKGIPTPVFEARVDLDFRLIFTTQTSTVYRERGGTDRPRMVLVVWDVDHHDDALNRARRLAYDNLVAAEGACLPAVLHEGGVLEEMSISELPEYPWVPVDVVEREVKKGAGVLNQYVRLQYRGEDWWMEQATRWERESLADAHEFLEIDVERIEQELAHIAQNDEDFLLHLLPEQMEFVRAQGPLLLSGTVGSGKTTVMLYHLYRQVRTNPNGQYLVVTYSPNLSTLCQLLFERLPDGRDLLERVSILSFTQLLRMINPGVHIISYDERRRQFEEAYAEVGRRWKMKAIPKPLHSFRQKHPTLPWHLETLWAEYWDVIKGQLNWATRGLLDREGYLQYAATKLTPEEREAVFSVYEQWFTQLPGTDELDVCRQIWREQQFSGLRYLFDGVYVDEVQDLCEVQWMILLQMVKSPTGLFLTGDPFQALRPSGFHWNRLKGRLQSEIAVQDASLGINRRNSRQIASLVQKEMGRLSQRLELEDMPDYHVTAILDSLPPAGVTEQQIDSQRLAEWLGDQGALVIPDESARNHPLAKQLASRSPVVTVEECKGLEFDRVAVLGMYAHLEEAKRERAETLRQLAFSQWYVAMTRARRGLLVIEPEAQLLPTGLTFADEVWFGTWRDIEEVVVRSMNALFVRTAELYEVAGQFVVAAEYYKKSGQYQNAMRCEARKTEAEADWAQAGQLYEQIGYYADAGRCYEQAHKFAEAGMCYEKARLHQDVIRCEARKTEAEADWAQAGQLYEQIGYYADAGRCYEQAHKFAEAGMCYEKANQFAKSAACYEKVEQFGKAAEHYERARRFDKAGECYVKVNQFMKAGVCYEKAKKYANAKACYEKCGQERNAMTCEALLSEHGGNWSLAAQIYDNIGNYSSAGRCYERAGDFLNAGVCYEKAENFAKAAECYEKIGQPGDAVRCKAKLAEREGNWLEAAQLYERICYHGRAGRCYERAREFVNAGMCYEQARDFEKAGECYEKANLFGEAGECYEEAGYYILAAECYKEAGLFKDAARCRRKAREGRGW